MDSHGCVSLDQRRGTLWETIGEIMPFPCCRYARGMISGTGSTLFEELGLYYIGPVDGHNVDDLVSVLNGTMDKGSLLLLEQQEPVFPSSRIMCTT